MARMVFFFLLVTSIYQPLSAQMEWGTIKGKVTDAESGEEMIGVEVTIKNENGSLPTGALSDFEGHYRLDKLEPGIYTLEVNYPGYEEKIVEEVKVQPGRFTIMDVEIKEWDPGWVDPWPFRKPVSKVEKDIVFSLSSLMLLLFGALALR